MVVRNLALLTLCFAASVSSAEPAEQTLAKQLEKMAANSSERLPAPLLKRFASAIDEVRATDIENLALQIGDEAPDGTLIAWGGDEVVLSDLWKQQPVVLTWYRGGWCPYCNIQLRALQTSLADLDGAGAKLVAITPELPANAKETAEKNELSFLVLHDEHNKLARKFGIVFDLPDSIAPIYRDRLQLPKVNGYDKLELPLAATYIVDRDGIIRWAFLDADYKKRAEPADVVEAVKILAQPK